MKQKIQTLLSQLNHGLIEREATLKIALLTVLAGENVVLIGPPGTGKSMIARRIADGFAHSSGTDKDQGKEHPYFEYLLTKFSTPEEIFGPLSITALKADCFKRNTAGYLPTVKIAFLDEIFKASSSILNALLTILNERIYHNGSIPEAVPMQALIAASNELPTDQEELSALYDRFLARVFVDYVREENLHLLFETVGDSPALAPLSPADLASIKTAAEAVIIPPDIKQAVQRIWSLHKETFKDDRREGLSDRRLKKVIKLMRVSAATNGRSEVDLSDVLLLKNCLWNHQDNTIKTHEMILALLRLNSVSGIDSGGISDISVPAIDSISSNIIELRIPSIGSEGTVVEVLVNSGDIVEKNQSLICIELDKAAVEVPATERGTVKDIKITLGDKVSESDIFLTLEVGVMSPAIAQKDKKNNGLVKGLRGSGTAQDPLLINTVDDLMDLSRLDVGLKGYYFRQTSDIDCSAISSWPDISFKGHYDGGGYIINYISINKPKIGLFSLRPTFGMRLRAGTHNPVGFVNLFNNIRMNSSVTRLQLDKLHLANSAEESHISRCTSSDNLLGMANDCTLQSCQAGGHLVANVANNCSINMCQAADCLVGNTAIRCEIKDCLVVTGLETYQDGSSAGIALNLKQSSVVERCFSTGKIEHHGSGEYNFCGIAETAEASIIRKSAFGRLDRNSTNTKVFRTVRDEKNGCKLENNASIDSNSGREGIIGGSCKTVSAILFNQRYFENTLHWDFDAVWKWDDKEDRPSLRSVGVGAVSPHANTASQDIKGTDLLTQKILANIWL